VCWGQILMNVASIFKHTNPNFLRHLEQNSEWLQQQLGQYAGISGDFETKFGYEMYPTPIALGKSILVSRQFLIRHCELTEYVGRTQMVCRCTWRR
jgi:hypothetical protein